MTFQPAAFNALETMVEVFDLRQKPRALLSGGNFIGFERFNFLRAGFNGIAFGVAVGVGVRGFDDPEMIEEKRDTARLHRASRP